MKNLQVLAVFISILSTLFITNFTQSETRADKAYLGLVIAISVSGKSINAVTFDYIIIGFSPGNQYIQVSNSSSFRDAVRVVLNNNHSITVDCSELTPGQAFCRIVETDNDAMFNITQLLFGFLSFTLPH